MKELAQINEIFRDKETINIFRSTARKSLQSMFETFSKTYGSGQDALKTLINSNHLQVSPEDLKRWLENDKPMEMTEGLLRIDKSILSPMAANESFVNRATRRGASEAVNPAEHREGFLCQVIVSNKEGRSLGKGTGFFLTDNVVITCYHVLAEHNRSLKGLQVKIEVPHFYGRYDEEGMFDDVILWSALAFTVKKSLGEPLLLASSPNRSEEVERGDWNGNAPVEPSLDYCVLEIEPSSQKHLIKIHAGRDQVGKITTHAVVMKAANQYPSLIKPASFHEAEELNGISVSVQTLIDKFSYEQQEVGSVKEVSADFQRIRYGDEDNNLHKGDSGSPVTNNRGEIVGLHNASTERRGQAIPIGYIYEDILKQNPNLLEMIKATNRSV